MSASSVNNRDYRFIRLCYVCIAISPCIVDEMVGQKDVEGGLVESVTVGENILRSNLTVTFHGRCNARFNECTGCPPSDDICIDVSSSCNVDMTCFTHRNFGRHCCRNGQIAIHSRMGCWKDGVTSESEGDDAAVLDGLRENLGEIVGGKSN